MVALVVALGCPLKRNHFGMSWRPKGYNLIHRPLRFLGSPVVATLLQPYQPQPPRRDQPWTFPSPWPAKAEACRKAIPFVPMLGTLNGLFSMNISDQWWIEVNCDCMDKPIQSNMLVGTFVHPRRVPFASTHPHVSMQRAKTRRILTYLSGSAIYCLGV